MILHLGPSKYTNGGISSFLDFAKSLSFWLNFDCVLISSHSDGNCFHKCYIYFLAFLNFFKYIFKCDIVHFHISWYLSLLREFPFFLFAFFLRKKMIIHLHSGFEPIKSSKFYFLYKFLFSISDKCIFLSPAILEEFISDLGFSNKFIFIPNSFRSENIQNSTKNKSILFLGHIKDTKGVFYLLEGFSKFSKIYPDWTLYIGGSGSEFFINKLKQEIIYYQIEHSCVFLGWLNYSKKISFLLNSSIFCLPSFSEGFPMTVLEAWAFKCAVISTNVGGLKSYLLDEENCLIIKERDSNDIYESFLKLVTNSELMVNISSQGFLTYKTYFSSHEINKLYFDLYNELT